MREVLLGAAKRVVVGHGDWKAQNISWEGENLALVHGVTALQLRPDSCGFGGVHLALLLRMGALPTRPLKQIVEILDYPIIGEAARQTLRK